MRVLVTGGAGVIGSNLAEALVEKGHGVVVLDNLMTGSMQNLEKIKDKIEIISGDVADEKSVLETTKNIDIIFHQGGVPSSPLCDIDRKKATEMNVWGFVNLLNACSANGVKKVIFASTSSIYGNLEPPLKEDMNATPPNFYAITKYAMEFIAKMYGVEKNIETIGLRYMSIYGPKEESKKNIANLVSQFLWAMQKNERPIVYGDGTQTRDFTYVKDVVQANILAMESKKNFFGEIFNVGTGQCHSLNELIRLLNKLLGKNIEPEYVKIPVKNYIATQVADITKIRQLGFEPKYSLEEGIKDMLRN